ncbi:MAG: CHASE3 domain-containing protein [Acidobacteriia bacterium]|nr:CHASE3 domain-containing protein [Terriglobia bacterium]
MRQAGGADGTGLERRGRGAFLVLGFVPVFLTAVLPWAVQQNHTDALWVDHTHDVLSALGDVDRATTRGESSARAYFATFDASRLDEFEQLRGESMDQVRHLRELVADSGPQQQKVDALTSAVQARLEYLAENIGLVQSGSTMTTLAATRGELGREKVAELNEQIISLRAEEQRLLSERVAARRLTNWILSLLCLSAMLVSLAIAFRGEHTIRRYRDLRDRAEGRLTMLNEELENRVRERTRDLERSNEDLRQFAFAASHDLNEPLRTVGIYTDMLRKRYLTKLDHDGDLVVGFILKGVERMDGLLSGLRTYMQVSSLTRDSAPLVDLNAGVDAAMLDLKAALDDSGASLERGDLPKVRMHPVHARQIFQNLIGNALKYRSAKTPVIAISAEEAGSEWIIHVRDNGIGIDPKYQAHIFGLFKRLHPADEIPGSGLGLPICRSIVQQCGGKMWVESEVGEGATFSFTLPRAA